jgi:hypothetical protein
VILCIKFSVVLFFFLVRSVILTPLAAQISMVLSSRAQAITLGWCGCQAIQFTAVLELPFPAACAAAAAAAPIYGICAKELFAVL